MSANYYAIVAAAIASFLFGGVWYGVLSDKWLAAIGKTEDQLKAKSMPSLYALTFAAQLVMAWVLAGLMVHMAKDGVVVTPRFGLITAAICWAGFVATTLAINHGYQHARRELTLIDGGHWLGVMLLQGAILGWLGPT
jgi:hypothetical protein